MFQIPYEVPRGAPEYVPSTFKVWFGLFTLFWIFFGLVLLVVPKSCSDGVLETAFPFLPKRSERDH